MLIYGEHKAAVKAIDWNPMHRHVLVTGAGANDRNIRIFNI